MAKHHGHHGHHEHHEEKKHHGHHEEKHHGHHKEKHHEHVAQPLTEPYGGPYPIEGAKLSRKERRAEKKGSRKEKKSERRREKKEKIRDRGATKLRSGHKYTRLQRFETLDPQQKRVLQEMGRHEHPEHFHEPRLMAEGLDFLGNAVNRGPPEIPLEREGRDFTSRGMREGGIPTSPVEGAGQTFLQRLLGEPAQNMVRDYEAPYMRQFYEETAPEIAERYAGMNGLQSSSYRQAMARAGAGLHENLASLKANLVQQLIGQQLQGANVGLGYSQLPAQRYGQQQQNANMALAYSQIPANRWQQQLQAAQIGIPASLIPQQQQQAMNQYADQAEFSRQQQILGVPPWGQVGVPPRGRAPTFFQQMLPRAGGALAGGLSGAAIGSVVPGIGTALGGAIGGIAGLLGGGGAVPPVNLQGPTQINAAPTK